jgi:hypothetical protein
LVAFDAAGVERPEETGAYSRELTALVARAAPTDVFVLGHEGRTMSARDPRNSGASSWKREPPSFAACPAVGCGMRFRAGWVRATVRAVFEGGHRGR